MRLLLLPALAVLLALGLAACGDDGTPDDRPTDAASAGPLDGRTYVATSVTEGGAHRPLVEGTELRLTFGGGRVGIQAGCNTMSGPYTVEDGTLAITDLATTEIACDPPLAVQDEWITGLLEEPLAIDRGEKSLTLTVDDTVVELVPREIASPDASLTGTTWHLDTITTGSGPDATARSVPKGVTAKLRINADGTLEVDTGCNTGVGRAEVDAGTLTVATLGTTRQECPGPAARRVEQAVLAMLDGEVDHLITEQQLTLTRGERELVWRTEQ